MSNSSAHIHGYAVREGEKRDGDIKHLVKNILPGAWAQAAVEDIVLTSVGGGITNVLFKAEGPKGEEPVLVRIYGENTDILVNRDRDNHLFHELATLGFAPPYRGRFENGRIEGFVDARPLEPHEMSLQAPINFVSLIAAEMARLHRMPVTKAGPKGRAEVWETIPRWLQLAKGLTFDDEAKAAAVKALDLEWVCQEIAWVQRQLRYSHGAHGENEESAVATLENGGSTKGKDDVPVGLEDETVKDRARRYLSEVVLSHNDLLSGNVMYADGWEKVQVIDFEYSGYNPRGFDIANHFCEHAGFDSNFAKSYPCEETQIAFLTDYVRAVEKSRKTHEGGDTTTTSPGENMSTSPLADDASFIAGLMTEVNRWTLPSHLWWTAWAVVQARYSPINFDFVDYARLRLAGYRLHKKIFFGSE